MPKQSPAKKNVNPPLTNSSNSRKANKGMAEAGSPKKRSPRQDKTLPDTSSIPWLRTGT